MSPHAQIFKRLISLEFNNNKSEDEFQKSASEQLYRNNYVFSNLNIVNSICVSVFCFYLYTNDLDDIKMMSRDPGQQHQPSFQNNLRKINFSKTSLKTTITNLLILVAVRILQSLQSYIIQKLALVLNYSFYGISFHLLAGILRSYYLSSSDPLVIIQGFQIFVRVTILLYIGRHWILIFFSTIFLIGFQCIMMYIVHDRINTTVKYYLISDFFFLAISIILVYFSEKNNRERFYFEGKRKLEKDYMFDIINNFQDGFFVLNKDGAIKFANQYSENMLSQKHSRVKQKRSFDMFNGSTVLNSADLKNTLASQESERFTEEFVYLLSYFKRLEDNLPTRLYNFLTQLADQNKSHYPHIDTSKDILFNIGEFIEIITDIKEKFSSFEKLGNIFWKKNNTILNTNELTEFEYEVSVRVVSQDESTYIEFILHNISSSLLQERKDIINSCKNNYLSKIAHEIKNPLCQIMELTDEIAIDSENILTPIIEKYSHNSLGTGIGAYQGNQGIVANSEAKKVAFDANKHIIQKIRISSINIMNICNLMNFLIQDFVLTSSLNELCLTSCKPNFLCNFCSCQTKCLVCNTCVTCEKNKIKEFEHKELIKDVVTVLQTKNEFDKDRVRNYQILDSLVIRNPHNEQSDALISPFIVNNEDYFNSLIFNTLYYIYNNGNNSHVFIRTKEVEDNKIQFEIIDTDNMEDFGILTNMANCVTFEEFIYDKNLTNSYEKYVHLYNSYTLSRKLGSDTLYLDFQGNGSRYTFFVKNYNYRQFNKNQSITSGVFTLASAFKKKLECKHSAKEDSDSERSKHQLSEIPEFGQKVTIEENSEQVSHSYFRSSFNINDEFGTYTFLIY